MAKSNLLLSSATKPMYPIILCIRCLMEDIQWSLIAYKVAWKSVLIEFINLCYEVSFVASPIVNSSNPEGIMPDDLELNKNNDFSLNEFKNNISLGYKPESSELNSDLNLNLKEICINNIKPFEDGSVNSESCNHNIDEKIGIIDDKNYQSYVQNDCKNEQNNVEINDNFMPQYLVVCCWRSIKEISLALGLIVSNIKVDDLPTSILIPEQVESISLFLKKQLLECRHRGAFELAYTGFVQMCNVMWHSNYNTLQVLPAIWLIKLLTKIESNISDDTDELCSTRRSAGIPYFIQAIVSTEPILNNYKCLKDVIGKLLIIAENKKNLDYTSHVHSRNILRSLMKDSKLSEYVQEFIGDSLQVAIIGYDSNLWGIKNSSMLLFSSLVTRIFGVHKQKIVNSKSLLMSGKSFFKKFPTLFPFLKEQLNISSQSKWKAKQSNLYLILILLSKLTSSTTKEIGNKLNVEDFIPLIIDCGKNPVFKIRLMSAKALSSLVSNEDYSKVIHDLLKSLEENVGSDKQNNNLFHGTCLQILSLLNSMERLSISAKTGIYEKVLKTICIIKSSCTNANPCYVTRTSMQEIISCILFISSKSNITVCNLQNELGLFLYNQFILEFIEDTVEVFNDKKENIITSKPYHKKYMMTSLKPCLVSKEPGYINLYASLIRNSIIWISIQYDSIDNKKQMLNIIGSLLKCTNPDLCLNTINILYQILSQLQGNDNIFNNNQNIGMEILQLDSIFNQFEISEIFFKELCQHIYMEIIDIIMSNDIYHLIIIQAMLLLDVVMKSNYFEINNQILIQLMKRMNYLLEYNSWEEIKEKAMKIAGFLCSKLYFSNEKIGIELVNKFSMFIYMYSSETTNFEIKIATCEALITNSHILLVDPLHKLECHWENWSCLIRLLHDDSLNVRLLAAKSVNYLIVEPKELLDLQPEYALEEIFNLFINIHLKEEDKCISGGFQIIIDWLIYDLDPTDKDIKQELGLFDRGQFNTYRDDIHLTIAIYNKFKKYFLTLFDKESDLKDVEISPVEKISNYQHINCQCKTFKTFKNKKDMNNLILELKDTLKVITLKKEAEFGINYFFLNSLEITNTLITSLKLFCAIDLLNVFLTGKDDISYIELNNKFISQQIYYLISFGNNL